MKCVRPMPRSLSLQYPCLKPLIFCVLDPLVLAIDLVLPIDLLLQHWIVHKLVDRPSHGLEDRVKGFSTREDHQLRHIMYPCFAMSSSSATPPPCLPVQCPRAYHAPALWGDKGGCQDRGDHA